MKIEIDHDIFLRQLNMVIISDDDEKAYTFELVEHKLEEFKPAPKIKIEKKLGRAFLNAMAAMLQRNGYLPQAATDAELKATKFHLEDMRNLAEVMKVR